MDNRERQQLRELLRANESRLRALELQAAHMGVHAPTHVLTEIEAAKAEISNLQTKLVIPRSSSSRSELRILRAQSRTAQVAQEWERAEELLIQVLSAAPYDTDARNRLEVVQRKLYLKAYYQAIGQLRDEGLWHAVLNALDDLERRQSNYPDDQSLREWAEHERDIQRIPKPVLEQIIEPERVVLSRGAEERWSALHDEQKVIVLFSMIEDEKRTLFNRLAPGEKEKFLGFLGPVDAKLLRTEMEQTDYESSSLE